MSTPVISDELNAAVKRIKTDTDRELAVFLDHKIAAAGKIDPQYRRLITEMKKFILRGGKRLRPFMAYLGYQVAGGEDYDTFIRTAIALEIYHSFAVIHDDIMDNDMMRYGGPNISGAYERHLRRSHPAELALLHSRNAALLAGDVALGFALELIQNSPAAPEIRERLHNELLKLHFTLAGGQLLDDLATLDKTLKVARIRKVYYLKTARYSMIFPLQTGAILADGNDTILQILERYGTHAGIAYQIADDLLGMFGSSREIGKPNISDLREGKQTMLMHFGFEFAGEADRKVLSERFGKANVSAQDLKLVRKILSDNGAKAKTIFMAQSEAAAAKKAIGRLAMPGTLPSMFGEFTDFLISRLK